MFASEQWARVCSCDPGAWAFSPRQYWRMLSGAQLAPGAPALAPPVYVRLRLPPWAGLQTPLRAKALAP